MYAELHCKSNYSFLQGASHPDELISRAVELGYRGLAITDENSLAGVVRAYSAWKECCANLESNSSIADFKLIIGAEIIPRDAPAVVLWAVDRQGYGNLSKLISIGRRRAPKGECWLSFDDISQCQNQLLAGVIPQIGSRENSIEKGRRGSSAGQNPEASHLRGRAADDVNQPWFGQSNRSERQKVGLYRDLFGDRCYLLASLYRGIDDGWRLDRLQQHSRQTGIPLVTAGDVLYHDRGRMPLHDVLTATRYQMTVSQAEGYLLPNAERHLQSISQRKQAFANFPDAFARTLEIADRCQFCLSQLRYEYPHELTPDGQFPIEYLSRLVQTGANSRYPQGVPTQVQAQLQHELRLIEELKYEAYFLTVWDLVKFARERNILCQGRGSAANSAVCYCLGITAVDPATSDLLFERFISKERNEAPDIDVDFEHERREEVLQYLYQKYGRQRAGLAAAVVTYRMRSAVRDVGKALGLSLDRTDALAKQIDGYAHDDKLEHRMQTVGLDPTTSTGRQLKFLVNELLGFPRHLSQHVGGMVITEGNLDELVPIENAAMDGRTVIQWDKDDLESLGLLKVDCLCLGMLSAIRKCFALIDGHWGQRYDLATVPQEDPLVYDMICAADTVGVFQIESRGQMSMLPRLKPRCWYDLVIEVAIVRPGPIQGNMVHPYLRRRNGESPVDYPTPAIKAVLERTLGVPIFQEQAMKLAVVAAGFTPGEADQLRRAMGKWRKSGIIQKFHQQLVAGMRARGLSDEFAEQVFHQISGFGEYGFPESHAASFAKLVYVSAWLKHYFPAAFCAALLNSQPMGFYAPAQLVADAKRHQVNVLPIDVNDSDWDCTLEPVKSDGDLITPSIGLRLGMRMISGLRRDVVDCIQRERDHGGPFSSIADITRRCRLSQAVIAQLSHADAFGSVRQDRRSALWQALAQEKQPKDQPLFAGLDESDDLIEGLPILSPSDQVTADYQATGLSLKAHPLSFYRQELQQLKVTPCGELMHGISNRYVWVAGLVLIRQRPSTAKGITFVTIEDETGTANLVVKPDIFERHYQIAKNSAAWLVIGKLEKKQNVIHVVVSKIEDLSDRLADLRIQSRDFR